MGKQPIKRVLGVDPFSRGVGFAVLEGADSLIDWGLKSTGRAHNEKAVRVIEALISRFQPDVLALEDSNSPDSRRCARVEKLLDRIAKGENKHVQVRLISRRHLRRIGSLPQASTKYGRACLIAERFPELQAFLPPVRKAWMAEDDRMAIFDAAGFAVACFATPKPTTDPPARTPA